jgi:hypothetical protein
MSYFVHELVIFFSNCNSGVVMVKLNLDPTLKFAILKLILLEVIRSAHKHLMN